MRIGGKALSTHTPAPDRAAETWVGYPFPLARLCAFMKREGIM